MKNTYRVEIPVNATVTVIVDARDESEAEALARYKADAFLDEARFPTIDPGITLETWGLHSGRDSLVTEMKRS